MELNYFRFVDTVFFGDYMNSINSFLFSFFWSSGDILTYMSPECGDFWKIHIWSLNTPQIAFTTIFCRNRKSPYTHFSRSNPVCPMLYIKKCTKIDNPITSIQSIVLLTHDAFIRYRPYTQSQSQTVYVGGRSGEPLYV